MILKVFVLSIVAVQVVLARNTRGNIRYEGYKSSVNHPPAPEIYEAIPVSVVYDEGSSRGDKSIKNGIQTTNNVKSEDKELVKSEPIEEKGLSGKHTSPTEAVKVNTSADISLDSEKHDTTAKPEPASSTPTNGGKQIPVSTSKDISLDSEKHSTTEKSKPASSTPTNGEQQIPVAIIYDLESSYTVDAPPIRTPTKHRVQAKVRKVQRPPIEENAANNHHISDVIDQEYNEPAIEDVQLKSVKVSEKTQEQKPIVAKENQDTHRSGNGQTQTILKRDNSTRLHEFVPIIHSENILLSHSGNFKYSYEGADGTKAFEHGELKKFEDDKEGEAVSGGFSYTDKDGNEFSLSYTADENGYRPVGAHLPTPPPIPPAIARALAHLATKTTPEPVTESLSDEI